MTDTPWNAAAITRRRWIMERLTEAAAYGIEQPTLRELSNESGVVISVIAYDLMRLERHGYIQRGPANSERTIRVLVPFLTGRVERKADAA